MMKKVIFLLTCVIGLGAAFGQSNKVQSAINAMKPEPKELDKARLFIDAASVHPKTSMEAKTWYWRGVIYYNIFHTTDQKYKNLDPDPLKQAWLSFVKAKQLDAGKRYEKDLIFELTRSAADFFNKGSVEYEQKKFPQAVESFETAMAIGKLPYINQLDTGLFYSAALAAEAGQMYDKAIEYYSRSIELNFNGPEVFHYLAEIYLIKGDPGSALKTLESGIKKYPAHNTRLYIDVINYYLGRKDINSAFGYIEIALKKDSTNASLWMVYGQAIEDQDRQKAIEAYKKVNVLDPKNFDGFSFAGRIYFNLGVEANEKAARIPLSDDGGYKAAMAVADGFFRQALPYFENAYEINREDTQLLVSLSQIYYRFKMNDKLAEIKKQMERMK